MRNRGCSTFFTPDNSCVVSLAGILFGICADSADKWSYGGLKSWRSPELAVRQKDICVPLMKTESRTGMFGRRTTTPWFYETSVHIEAISRIAYLIDSNAGFALVHGADGCGRTSVLRKLQQELRNQQVSAPLLNAACMDAESLLRHLIDGLAIFCPAGASRSSLLMALRDELRGRSHCGIRTVILLDDVHRGTDDMASVIPYLTGLAEQSDSRVSVVACSRTFPVPGITENPSINIFLAPLTTEESREFIAAMPGRDHNRPLIAENSAVSAICELSAGVPARLIQFYNLLQVVQEASPETRIDAHIVREIAREVTPRAVA